MSQEWMLDLLTDLKGFAQKNAMVTLTEHLDDALIIAAREIGEISGGKTTASSEYDPHHGLPRAATDDDYA